MENKDYKAMTDEELLAEKKKMTQSKIWHALLIGILAGILLFGFGVWFLSSDKKIGFLIPMLIPVVMIYKMVTSPNKYRDLEAVLRERGLE